MGYNGISLCLTGNTWLLYIKRARVWNQTWARLYERMDVLESEVAAYITHITVVSAIHFRHVHPEVRSDLYILTKFEL